MSVLLVVLPGLVQAQSEQMAAAPPSIEQPLIREGDFAVKLEVALSMGTPQNEVEAENQLAAAGIMPKNGWIADYPVTPDIVAELYATVRAAADANKIPLAADSALQRLSDTMSQVGLSAMAPAAGDDTTTPQLPGTPGYPSATDISDYYYDAGPPVVTYYAPPTEYYYLYGWVPFPFWCDGFWFPGYFILHDFHRHVHHGDRDGFVSNHVMDERGHRFFRIDPDARLRGKTMGLNSVMPRAGATLVQPPVLNHFYGRELPKGGTAIRPSVIRRGGASSNYQKGYGFRGRPMMSQGFGAFHRSPAVMAPPIRTGGSSWSRGGAGMPSRAFHGISSPIRSSGFGGMHYSAGGFAGRGRR